ncbi:hypothetical protein E5D57_004389 [Metarhizium anisopliae]|nr:hypothetical protein E5D57_004389 [Metarhizium anisopliae]
MDAVVTVNGWVILGSMPPPSLLGIGLGPESEASVCPEIVTPPADAWLISVVNRFGLLRPEYVKACAARPGQWSALENM